MDSDDAERGCLLRRAVARGVGRAQAHPVAPAREAVPSEAAGERDRVAALRLRTACERAGADVPRARLAVTVRPRLRDAALAGAHAGRPALERRRDLRRLAEREADPRAAVALGAYRC